MAKKKKRGHYIIIKESIHQEDKTVNIYASNIRAFKYKENTIKELKEKYLSTQ